MPSPRPLSTAVAAAIAMTIGAGAPAAKPAKVALVALEIGGDGAPELRPQLAESIVAGLQDTGAATVELADVLEALAASPELIGCLSSTCLTRIGERVGANLFVRGRMRADGADYTMELELYDTNRLVHRLELPCAVCTIAELNQLARSTAKRLLEEAGDEPVPVVIRTQPSGAELTIDGLPRGVEPFEGPLPRGVHEVVAELPGGSKVTRRIEVSDASTADPIVIAIPGAAPPHGGAVIDGDEGSSLGTIKWVTAGGAVAALALGGTLLALDGRPTCDDEDRECSDVLDTRVGGWISIGVGGAAGLLAGWMFYADRDPRHDRAISVTPTRGGAAASLRLTF